MKRVEVMIREFKLPPDAEPMAGHDLSDGTRLEFTLKQWEEIHAWLDLGGCADEAELRGVDERAP